MDGRKGKRQGRLIQCNLVKMNHCRCEIEREMNKMKEPPGMGCKHKKWVFHVLEEVS